MSFPDFSDPILIGPAVAKLFPFLFLLFPDFSGCFRLLQRFPFSSGCVRPPQNCCLCSFSHFRIIPNFPDPSDFFRRFPDAIDRRKIVPLPVLVISGIFRLIPDASDRRKNCSPSCSCHFRNFQIDSGCVRPPQNCSPSCSSHFRIFPGSCASDVFPGASDRHNIVSLPVPLISGVFRILPTFSDLFRMRPTATKLFPFLFFSIPEFSGFSYFFRLRPTATKLFPVMFLALPYVSRFFRFSDVFPAASDRHKVVPCHVPRISVCFQVLPLFQRFSGCVRPPQTCSPALLFFSFSDFSGFCLFCASHRRKIVSLQVRFMSGNFGIFRLFRLVLDASDRNKIDQAPYCL